MPHRKKHVEKHATTHLVKEAKKELHKENLKKFFNKNNKHISRSAIVAFAVLIILVIANSVQSSREKKFSEIFHQSLIDQQLGNEKQAREKLQKIYDAKSAPSGVRSLAALRLAAAFFNEGNLDGAEKIYSEISSCGSCDDYLRDLAGLLLVKTWLSDEGEISKDDIITRVEKVENSNKLLKFYISEQRAFLESSKGNLEKSYQILELIIKSSESPKALKERAENSVKILESKGFEKKSDAKFEAKVK